MIDVGCVCSLVRSWLLGSGNGRILEIYTFFEYVIQFTKISSRFIIFMNVSGNPLIKPKIFSSFFYIICEIFLYYSPSCYFEYTKKKNNSRVFLLCRSIFLAVEKSVSRTYYTILCYSISLSYSTKRYRVHC